MKYFVQMNFLRIRDRARQPVCGIIFAMLTALELPGAEPGVPGAASPAAPVAPVVREVRPGLFQIGAVHLDQRLREVRIPATVNLRQGHIEYLLVTATGKTHESLLRTSAEPLHVRLAFVLLGAKGAGNLPLATNPVVQLPGEKVSVSLTWTNAGRTKRAEPTQFVLNRKKGTAVRRGSWNYTGSRMREDGFAAQLDGSIVSLITDPDALINNSRPGREDDDNWLVRDDELPPVDTPMEVLLRLER